jgi:hypothetical protein
VSSVKFNTKMPVSNEDLLAYFSSRKSRFINSNGMELGLTAGNEFWTYFVLCSQEQAPLAISISTEEDRPEEFIAGFNLASLEDSRLLAIPILGCDTLMMQK